MEKSDKYYLLKYKMKEISGLNKEQHKYIISLIKKDVGTCNCEPKKTVDDKYGKWTESGNLIHHSDCNLSDWGSRICNCGTKRKFVCECEKE